jgi:hypothetical protein
MDERKKQRMIVVALLVLVGTVATVASGHITTLEVEQPRGPQVVALSVIQDSTSKIRVYRAWSDGFVETTRKINGSEDYVPWMPVE